MVITITRSIGYESKLRTVNLVLAYKYGGGGGGGGGGGATLEKHECMHVLFRNSF